ncbi:MAG: PAS domain S-box protein [Acidobacteria bacterium]|nr:PAS domain S-box protein [Acidobacteriota bacterium]
MKKQQTLQNRILELEKKCSELEKNLRHSEDRFSTLFHAASNPMTIISFKEDRMVDANEACARLSGYKREELIGTLSSERTMWADAKQRDILIQKIREEGSVHNIEAPLITRAGELKKVLFSADPVNMNGEPCLLGILVDITAREKAAETLRKSEEKYRMLVENSLQGLAVVQNDQLKFCNKAYAEMTGYSVEELLSFADSRRLIHPEDREFVLNRSRKRLSGEPVPTHYEHRIIRKNGEIRWHEIRPAVVEFEGEPATQVACIDITERKNAEEAIKESHEYLNRILNATSDGIFVKDNEYKLVLVNDSFCAFRDKRREDLLGKTGMEELPEEMAKIIMQQEEEVLKTGREQLGEEIFPNAQGNRPSILMVKRSLLTDRKGNRQIVTVGRDITQYKQLEAQFLQAQKMEAIGALAGGVAHDFNNLLNVINGYSELVLETLEPDNPIREDIGHIRTAAQNAASLTTQLLAFSRKQILQPEILDLNETITQMSTMLRRVIGEDIEIAAVTQPDLGLVNADPGQIQQIIMNLAINARDAMPRGGKLTIETANFDCDEDYVKDHPAVKAGPYVMLAITDNGIGMDEETKTHLFEPFFTTKAKGKGTGLGLSTIYGIVKQSNGFIWVYSELGKGTTFKVYFPRAQDTVVKTTAKAKAEPESGGSETVLVVEDEASVRELACRILKERGYTILEASNPKDAEALAETYEGKIHLVLTDVVMPGMSGKELVCRLKSIRPDIKALFTSGYTDNSITHQGILDPGVAFLQKPFTVKDMISKVREVIDS